MGVQCNRHAMKRSFRGCVGGRGNECAGWGVGREQVWGLVHSFWRRRKGGARGRRTQCWREHMQHPICMTHVGMSSRGESWAKDISILEHGACPLAAPNHARRGGPPPSISRSDAAFLLLLARTWPRFTPRTHMPPATRANFPFRGICVLCAGILLLRQSPAA